MNMLEYFLLVVDFSFIEWSYNRWDKLDRDIQVHTAQSHKCWLVYSQPIKPALANRSILTGLQS